MTRRAPPRPLPRRRLFFDRGVGGSRRLAGEVLVGLAGDVLLVEGVDDHRLEEAALVGEDALGDVELFLDRGDELLRLRQLARVDLRPRADARGLDEAVLALERGDLA